MPSVSVNPGTSGCRRTHHTMVTIETMRNAPENWSPPPQTAKAARGLCE